MAENRELQLILRLKDEASKGLGKLANSAEKNREGFETLALAGSIATASLVFGISKAIQSSNTLKSSLIGLSTVSEAFGQDAEMAKQSAIELASDGLLSVKSAATSLKNLLATGFSLPEAIELMKGFKDSASFNRQGTLEFGQAIEGATEGLKNQNSILVDNAGVTKNLSLILKDAGYSQQDLGKITSDAGVRQALYNGILKETAIFQGDAEKASKELAGKQDRLKTSTFNLTAVVGESLTPAIEKLIDIADPFVNNLTKWVENNKQLVATITAVSFAVSLLATAVGGLGLALVVTNSAIASTVPLVSGLGLAISTLLGPLGLTIAGITVIAGLLSSKLNKDFLASAESSNKLGEQADKMRQKLLGSRDTIKEVSNEIAKMGKEAQKTADKIKKLESEISKTIDNESKSQADSKRSLAEAFVAQEEKVAKLRKEIQEKEKEASKTTIKSSAHEELSILNAKLYEETASLERASVKREAIGKEIIEATRRAGLTDFELTVENIERKRAEDLKAFNEKLFMQAKELTALKAQHQKIQTAEKEHTVKLNEEIEKRAVKEESVAQRILRARNLVSGFGVANTTPTFVAPNSMSGGGGNTTIINNIEGSVIREDELTFKVGQNLMDNLRFNQKIAI